MKKISLILSILLSFHAFAQNSYRQQIPKGWKIISETKGDLNKDGIPDAALVVEENNPKKWIKNDELGPNILNTNPRGVMVFFAYKNGGYRLADKNFKGFIPVENSQENHCLEDPLAETDGLQIANNILTLDLQYWLSCGTFEVNHETYKFRFQNGSFELIGYERYTSSRSSGEAESTSINFSTKQKIKTLGLNEFKDSKPKTVKSLIKVDKLYRLSDLDGDSFFEISER